MGEALKWFEHNVGTVQPFFYNGEKVDIICVGIAEGEATPCVINIKTALGHKAIWADESGEFPGLEYVEN